MIQTLNQTALGIGYAFIIFASFMIAKTLLDAFLFATGYTIYLLLDVDYTKARKRPLKFVWIVLRWFFGEFVERIFGYGEVVGSDGKNLNFSIQWGINFARTVSKERSMMVNMTGMNVLISKMRMINESQNR
jgi:hypothetical protein